MATSTAITGNQRVPDGWRLVRLGDVAELGSGKAPTYDNEIGTVTVHCTRVKRTNRIDEEV